MALSPPFVFLTLISLLDHSWGRLCVNAGAQQFQLSSISVEYPISCLLILLEKMPWCCTSAVTEPACKSNSMLYIRLGSKLLYSIQFKDGGQRHNIAHIFFDLRLLGQLNAAFNLARVRATLNIKGHLFSETIKTNNILLFKPNNHYNQTNDHTHTLQFWYGYLKRNCCHRIVMHLIVIPGFWLEANSAVLIGNRTHP